jgi:hypothetical protein
VASRRVCPFSQVAFQLLMLPFIHPSSTGDEMPIAPRPGLVLVDYIDRPTSPPYASIKVFYRPRGKPRRSFSKPLPILFLELLRAQGIIPANDVESPINEKKRAREDGSPGPSRSRPKVNSIKSEEPSRARAQRIHALQVSQGVVCFPIVSPDKTCM